MSRILASLMGFAARRPVLVVLLAGVVAVAGGVLAVVKLEPQTSPDTLVGRGTSEYKASADYAERFGDNAVYVLVRQPVTQSALTSDLLRLIALEGCLSGALPGGQAPVGGAAGPCGKLSELRPAKVVFGPGTFINTSVGQIQDEFTRQQASATDRANRASTAARSLAQRKGYTKAAQDKAAAAAQQAVSNEFLLTYARIGLKYGLTAPPQINDTKFVSQLVFDATKAAGTPKSRFAYVFPAKDAALIQVRLRPDLTTAQRKRAIGLIRAAVAMPDWKLPNGKGTYVVTGAPVVVSDLTDSISRGIAVLLVGALLVMALVLAAVFRTRMRLLPLAVAITATGMTFGLLALLGASLTIATLAVLPVLIGLAVDYAIQLQSRVQEEEGRSGRGVRRAVQVVARSGAPTVLTAAAATAAGFLVLLLSPVPMVRGFGLLIVAGIAIAFGLAATLGTAVLALGDPTRPRGRRVPGAGAARALLPALRGARDLLVENPVARGLRRAGGAAGRRGSAVGRGAFALALRRPGRVLAIAAGVAVLGWGLDTQADVESDIQRLVPQDLQALSDLRQLQDATGVGGEVDLVVSSDALTEPATFAWMADYQQRVLKRAGYSAARGCGDANLCPALSLPDLFRGDTAKTKAGIEALLDAVPPYFSQGVITSDRKVASLAFGIRLMSVERQGRVIDAMREELDPPAGVKADLAGLPVLTAEANAKASSPLRRAGLLLAGLLAVGLVLLLALRSARRALLPLIPIALATGWTGLVLFVIRIDLNPMSVTLGALVIAISTEFSVLLSERYRRERLDGHAPRAALQRAYASTGAAVLASGVTAIAGFAVLVLSDIRMLRDFGAVTVVDLTVSLLGVLVVLPAVLVLDERGAFADLGSRIRRRLPAPPAPDRRSAARGRTRTAARAGAGLMAPGGPDGPLDFEDDPEDAARRERVARRQDPDLVAEGRSATGRRQTQPPARLPGGASRYGWFVGVVGVLLIATLSLGAFRSGSDASGSRGITKGEAAPPFAAPLALSALQGDVNVAKKAGSGDAGAVPACSVRRPDVLNLCALYEQGPVVLVFFAARGNECVKQLDLVDSVSARHPRVRFAAVSIRGDRGDLRRTIRDRRWRFPVGFDRDGILANAYGVAVCPQITFVRKGGVVADTSLGAIGARDLDQRVGRLEG